MSLLETIRGPRDLKDLSPDQLPQLAAEIRDQLIAVVTRNGGHLGPNLGVVELTIALHRVFDSPVDRIVFDTGHQSYVHKLLTGRHAEFGSLRQRHGLSGYPSRAESEHDVIENSHASTSLSYADGLAKAYQLRDEPARSVVAVIGDGALTGGMAWEALNNISADSARDRRLIIVVNDNGRSYQPTIGGLANQMAAVRISQRYENVLDYIKTTLSRAPLVGAPLYGTLHGIKKGLKDVLQPQVLFEDLGLKYLGPVDGHDEQAVEQALRKARDFGGPVLVHVITTKGFGYPLAEQNDEDCLHQVSPPAAASAAPKPQPWTKVFGQELTAIGADRPDVVAITAAMLHPTGLNTFAAAYPDRVYDVGIAEQHAVTSAAGLAMGGLHPVVAIYATFLNRAFDQVLTDVAMHRLPVTFVLDRAGVTGPDGSSHHGMWDFSILGVVPGLQLAAPRDAVRVAELLREAVAVSDGPTVLRFNGKLSEADLPAVGKLGRGDVLARPASGHRRGRAAARRRVDGRGVHRGRGADRRPGHRRHRGGPALGHPGRRGDRRGGRRAPAGGHRGGRVRGRRVRRRGGPAAARAGGRYPGADLRAAAGVPAARRAGPDPGAMRADPAAPGPRDHRGGSPAHPGTRARAECLTVHNRGLWTRSRSPSSVPGRPACTPPKR